MTLQTGYTKDLADRIKHEINRVVINQPQITDFGLTAALAGGHILIEGLPGLAKTLWARCFARTITASFKRVSFTSDLMPADILGTKVFDLKTSEFTLKKGPLFTNLFLADEINRTPPKTQSALLEVMEERSITIDGETHVLPAPFVVFATQNPVEFEGTYPLPEALVDRFSMKLLIDYPGLAAEKRVLAMYDEGFVPEQIAGGASGEHAINPVCEAEDFIACREEINRVKVDESVMNYILAIVETTRRVKPVAIGASPRGSIALLLNAKAYAAIMGRDFVTPDDIVELTHPVLRHRVILRPEAEIDGATADKILDGILSQVKVPR